MSSADTSLRIPDDFNEWLKPSRKNWVAPSISVLIPTIIAILLNFKPSLMGRALLPVYLLGFQVIVIAVLLSRMPSPLSNVDIAEQPSIAIEQFHRAWEWLWFFWILLYIGLAAQELWLTYLKEEHLQAFLKAGNKLAAGPHELQEHRDVFKTFLNGSLPWSIGLIITNVLNNLQTLAIVMCYLVVSKRTVRLKRAEAPLPWLRGAGILITITAAEVFLTFVVHKHWEASPVAVPTVFTWVSGFGAGVTIALLVGRLDSKLIGPPVWVVALLYFYAVIQPGWSAFPEKPNAKIFLVIAALVLKTLFFLLVYWLLKSGVLLYYLERIGELEKETKEQRREFLYKLQSLT